MEFKADIPNRYIGRTFKHFRTNLPPCQASTASLSVSVEKNEVNGLEQVYCAVVVSVLFCTIVSKCILISEMIRKLLVHDYKQ